jgi:hypothetical protein
MVELMALKLLITLVAKKGVQHIQSFRDSLVLINWMIGTYELDNYVLIQHMMRSGLLAPILKIYPLLMFVGKGTWMQMHCERLDFSCMQGHGTFGNLLMG